MKKDRINIKGLSLRTVFLNFLFDDKSLAIASGFFIKKDGVLFLVSNWHNFSGRNPFTKQPINSKTGAIPNKVKTKIIYSLPDEDFPRYVSVELDLNHEGKPIWFEHPQFGSRVDVAALMIPPTFSQNKYVNTLNSFDFLDINPEIGMDVFILGYPRGIATDVAEIKLPIWKRGSIASEPEVNIDNLPKLLVDTATREGMSGSPAIIKYKGWHEEKGFIKYAYDFLGIYSGRIPKNSEKLDHFKAQLGTIWKKRVIDEIIEGGKTPDV